MPAARPAVVRFYEKFTVSAHGCWVWTGSMNHGYGILRVGSMKTGDRRHELAHRFAYTLLRGPIPQGLELDHLCRNRACVNPDHLEAVTHLENVRRGDAGWATGRTYQARTHCRNGHEYTPENTGQQRGGRLCRTCSRQKVAAWRARQQAS